MCIHMCVYALKEKLFIFTLKVESLAEQKFDPRFRVICEYLSQIDSIFRVILYLSVNLKSTLNIESI